ncbi:MAG TPA: TonB-dependent receptor [Thermoanaerobaculia bacterium]|jgi:iron complex outermembrane receptor protein|nr:TonB-dependent receptor [Thermoanaerobaculia bacterium]
MIKPSRSTIVALLFAFLAGLWAPALLAQGNGRIEGRLTRKDGTGIGGVTVVIQSTSQATLTDSDGRYSFSGLPAGSYELSFTAGDSTDSASGVEVAAGQTRTVDKQVDWDVSFADSITVFSASRQNEKITEAPAAVTIITEEQIAREATHAQLPKLLEFTPGAEVTQSGIYDFNFNTRGFNSSLNRRVATLIDGRDPSVPFLGAQEWAAVSFPLDDIAQAELVRGPSAALYGANASSGVLNLITRRPKDSRGLLLRLTGGELSTFNVDGRYAGAINDATYFKVMAGLRQSGDFTVSRNGKAEYSKPCTVSGQTDCLPQERVPLNPEDDDDIKFGSARLDRYFSGGGALLTAEIGRSDISGPVFQTGIGRVQLVDVVRDWSRLDYSRDHFNFLASYNKRNAERQTALSAGNNVTLDDDNFNLEGQTYWGIAGDKARIVLGGSYQDENIDSLDPRTGRQTLIFNPVGSKSQAAYGQLDWNLADTLKLVLAGRYDDSDLHESRFSPKGSLVWAVRPNHTLRASYNEGFQVANYSEFFLQADVAAAVNLSPFEAICRAGGVSCGFDPDNNPATANTRVLALGNKDLELEEVKTWELGYTGILGGKAVLTAEYYNSKNENFITDLLPQVGTPLGRLNANFGPYQAPAALPAPVAALLMTRLRQGLGANFFILTNNLDGTPILGAVSYTNFGAVDTQGVDLGLNWAVTDDWSVNAAYSWFDFDIQDSQPGLDRLLLPNSPKNKAAFGLGYTEDRWNAAFSYRWVDKFRWVTGPFQGDVKSYSSVDLNANVDLTSTLSLGLSVANALDDEAYQSFGGDLIGRRSLLSLTYKK